MLSSLFIALVLCVALVSGLHEIPERARKGEFYKQLLTKHYHHVAGGLAGLKATPLTWQAPVDHFDASNNATFAQRYYVDAQYWDKKGPVFYEIGGEGTLNGPPGGFIAQLAQKHNALLIALEHRFYGESIPNGNVFTENYKYLSVEQALADLASFTEYYKGQVPETKDASWFVFGGSYPGALSSWYRASYPEASVGSLSSSGVVNCIIDYHDFDMSVRAAAGNECGNNIKRIQNAFQRTIEGSPKGFQYALSLFHCEKDMSHNDFYYMIADSWSMMIQYSAKTASCAAINLPADATDDEIMKNFAAYSNKYWGDDFCSGGFYNTKQLADPARWEVNSRSWRYQTCSQVSYFNTAPKAGSLRAQSVNLEYHLAQCAEAFGKKMFPASVEMNQKFGGEFPNAHNVFYSDFSDDPWQRASVNYPVGEDQPYFLAQCDDCGHCLDFHTPSPNDPAPLTQCRNEFSNYLSLWLQQAEAKKH